MDELNDLLRGITEEMKAAWTRARLPLPISSPRPKRPTAQPAAAGTTRPEAAFGSSWLYPGRFLPGVWRSRLSPRRPAIRPSRLWHTNSLPLQIARKTSTAAQPLARCTHVGGATRFTFETFNTNLSWLQPHKLDNLVRAYEAARAFAEQPVGWLLFTGGYGCGKTHLAAAIANYRIENDQSAIFVVVPDLLDHLRATFGPSSETSYDGLFDEIRNTAILILDDLGSTERYTLGARKIVSDP